MPFLAQHPVHRHARLFHVMALDHSLSKHYRKRTSGVIYLHSLTKYVARTDHRRLCTTTNFPSLLRRHARLLHVMALARSKPFARVNYVRNNTHVQCQSSSLTPRPVYATADPIAPTTCCPKTRACAAVSSKSTSTQLTLNIMAFKITAKGVRGSPSLSFPSLLTIS